MDRGVRRPRPRVRLWGNRPGQASVFPQHEGISLEITEELIARQTPEAQAIIHALLAKIRQLQEQLNQSPRNSSVPPSTEHPHAKPPRPQPQATRLRGGQPGHPRHERPLLPTEQCDNVIPLISEADPGLL